MKIWLFRFAVLLTCLSLFTVTGVQVKGEALFIPAPHIWTQVNTGGFGDIKNISVSAMAVYKNALYAAAYNWTQQPGTGASIWRYDGTGTGWTKITTPGDIGPGYTNTGFTTPFNYAVLGMKVYLNKLYVTTGWGGQMGRIWRFDGTNWEKVLQVADAGPGNPVYGFTVMEEFNGYLYAGVSNQNTNTPGTRIYRSATGNPGTWEISVTDGNRDPRAFNVTSLKAFGGALYAAVADMVNGVQVWKTTTGNYGDWFTVVNNGFGLGSQAWDSGGFAVFKNNLYLGLRGGGGGVVYRTANGSGWEQVTTNAFGRPQNEKIEGLIVYQNFMYAFTSNASTGMEVFTTDDGMTFSSDAVGGFASNWNKNTLWGNSVVEFNGLLYVGTSNYNPATYAPAEGGSVFVWTEVAPGFFTNTLYLPRLSAGK